MTSARTATLSALRPAADLYGDVATAYVDVSRTNEGGAHEVEVRVEHLRRALRDAGADEAMVEQVSSRILEPTGHGGEASRVVVAQDGRLVADVLLATAVPPHQHHGPIAHLLQLARAAADDVRYALVRLDTIGADITVASTLRSDDVELVSEGDHDVLHKIRGGGWAHRRIQSRVQDSYDRNADTVAADLDSLVLDEQLDLVLVTGEPYACSRVSESVGGRVSELLELLDHGGRAEGASDERLDEEVAAAVQRCRTRRMDAVLERLGGGRTAVGVADTLEALRRGEVETLVLLEGAIDDRTAYVGPEPLLLGHGPEELEAFGVEDPATAPLAEALVRAAIGQDADLLPLHAPVGALPDGVGAVLRFDTRPDPTDS